MKQFKKKALMDNPVFTRVFAVCVACLCWIIVAMMNVSEYTEIFRDVPVNIEIKADALAALGLNVIELSHELVSVEVEGERGAVGNLKPEDLTATIQIPPELVEPDIYDLRLTLVSPGENYRVVNYSPRQVRGNMVRLEQKTFDIVPQVTGAAPAAGYVLEEAAVTPRQITVTGPASEIDRIARCVVRHSLNQPLEKTLAVELPIVLLDAQGEEIDRAARHLSVNFEAVQLVISVLREKELPLDIRITHVPDTFPEGDLHYSMSSYEVLAAGPADTISRYQEIVLAYIDLRTISLSNNIFTFNVEMPAANIINFDNILSVTVTFPTSGWSEAVFNIPEVELLHKPSRYDVSLLTSSVPNVLLCGDSEVLETLTAEDVIAQVDLSERELTPGQHRLPIKLSAPGKGLVWAVGEYYAVAQVSEKE